MGIPESHEIFPFLERTANHYLKKDTLKADGSIDQFLNLVEISNPDLNEEDLENLVDKFIAELDACVLSYFGFHWDHADLIVDQVCVLFFVFKSPYLIP